MVSLTLGLTLSIVTIALVFLVCTRKRIVGYLIESKETTKNVPDVFSNQYVEVRNSSSHGRGAFALKDFKKGDLIEYAPLIKAACDNIAIELRDYYVNIQGNTCGYVMGYFNYYNDSKNPNAYFSPSEEDSSVSIIATRDIMKGDEIFNSYGNTYWKTRGIERYNLT
jgi:SET domain-containing protein